MEESPQADAENNKKISKKSTELSKSNEKLLDSKDVIDSFGKLDEKTRSVIVELMLSRTEEHSGPLPSPDYLERYDKIIPNGGERIMQMAEKQQNHRIKIENKVITSQSRQSVLGQIFGFILGIAGLASSTYLALNGQTTVAGIIGGTTVVGLVSVFVIGKKRQHKED